MKITNVEALYLRLPEVNDRADGTQDTLIHFPASAFVPVGSDFLPLDDAWDAVLQANQAIELNYWLLHDDLPAERWPCGRNAWLFLRLTMGECGQEILIRTPADLFQCNSRPKSIQSVLKWILNCKVFYLLKNHL